MRSMGVLAGVLVWASGTTSLAAPPPETDYCGMLARNIAGRQHGFLAGNHQDHGDDTQRRAPVLP